MIKEFNFKKGVKEAVRRLLVVKQKPIFMAVYGIPNSGKSYFISKVAEELRKYEIAVIEFRGYANKEVFEDIKRIFLESYLSKGTLPNFAYFFHCGISYFDPGDSEDPNYLAKEELGLKINLNVGIQNKKLNPGELCEFSMFSKELDFIINNLDSVKKKPLF